jgi:multisubunit Na+/H+ antiporter MnhC subunit
MDEKQAIRIMEKTEQISEIAGIFMIIGLFLILMTNKVISIIGLIILLVSAFILTIDLLFSSFFWHFMNRELKRKEGENKNG